MQIVYNLIKKNLNRYNNIKFISFVLTFRINAIYYSLQEKKIF